VQLSAEQRALDNTVHDFARSKFQGRALKYMDMAALVFLCVILPS
jgi:hypothetical protein